MDIYDVIIIGGGPAGLTAGIYVSRARMEALLIESYLIPGQALLVERVENYPGFPEGVIGFELMYEFKRQAKKYGLKVVDEAVENITKGGDSSSFTIWQVKTEKNIYRSLSVIVATGAQHKKLGVPGEEKFYQRGVSYCALCDGVLFKNKDVVVVGGGDSAAEEALFLAKLAKSVTLVHRRGKLRATPILQERLFSCDKIKILFNTIVLEIMGKDKVEAVSIKDVSSNSENIISCDGIFISIGLVPNTALVKGLVALDEENYIITDENMKTSAEGIYACGDCRRKPLRQIITACSDGAIAAFSAWQYVEKIKSSSSL
jgi:thioredoxin reductase (NADPH)